MPEANQVDLRLIVRVVKPLHWEHRSNLHITFRLSLQRQQKEKLLQQACCSALTLVHEHQGSVFCVSAREELSWHTEVGSIVKKLEVVSESNIPVVDMRTKVVPFARIITIGIGFCRIEVC